MFQFSMEKIAAIDIGSNAIRLSLARSKNKGDFTLYQKYRIPIRLGAQAFSEERRFSNGLIKETAKTFKLFRDLLDAEQIERYRAVATSACRDALNADEMIEAIYKKSGLTIEAISGDQEARLILSVIAQKMDFNANADYLLFDLGGGSLELSQIEHREVVGSKSFDLGTVRLLNLIEQQHEEEIDILLKDYQKKILEHLDSGVLESPNLHVVGTGGNFRRLLKLKRLLINPSANDVEVEDIKTILNQIEKTPQAQRSKKFQLKADRAEVIVPALKIMLMVCEKLPVKTILCPKIGLIEGIFLQMVSDK